MQLLVDHEKNAADSYVLWTQEYKPWKAFASSAPSSLKQKVAASFVATTLETIAMQIPFTLTSTAIVSSTIQSNIKMCQYLLFIKYCYECDQLGEYLVIRARLKLTYYSQRGFG